MSRKLICPQCGAKAERYTAAFDHCRRPVDYRVPVEIACEVKEGSPLWECRGCGFRFGNVKSPGEKLTPRSNDEWVALLSTMLPKPVRLREANEVLGGDPVGVVARVEADAILVMRAKVAWKGPCSPSLEETLVARIPRRSPARRVARAVMRAWSLAVAGHEWCPSCFRVTDPGHSFGYICHGCAERTRGVVF